MIRPHLPPLPQGKEAGFAAGEGSAHLFASLDVYHDEPTRSAALNMAIDEALLETATRPTIRFYQWNHPALSFGYFGKFDDIANHERDIVRRWTGGGIVFHGEDLTYSIVIPATDAAFGESSMSIYEAVHRAIQLTIGSEAELEGRGAAPRRPRTVRAGLAIQRDVPTEMCFANPVKSDVILNGRKIAGAAQRRTRRALLQQGSIQNVAVANGLADSFAEALCARCDRKQLDAALLARAEEIAEQKYGTSAWLRRR
jgi:lipoate-protein ligase A